MSLEVTSETSFRKKREYAMSENRIIIRREEIAPDTEFVEIPFTEWDAKIGDEGYYLIADVNKCGSHKCYFTVKEDQEYILQQSLMPIFGVKNREGFTMLIAEGMKCAFHMRVGVKDGNYYAVPTEPGVFEVTYSDGTVIKVDYKKMETK